MTCRICGKVWRGRRQVCPELCRSRHQAGLKIERQIAKHYRAIQARRMRRAACVNWNR